MTVEAPTVVVIRLNSGDEVLAIFHGEVEGRVKLEHPHYVRFNPEQGTVAMIPYCALSDEKYYEIWRIQVHFMVTANEEISSKFFKMINALEQKQTREVLEFEEPLDRLEAGMTGKNYVSGNDTKH